MTAEQLVTKIDEYWNQDDGDIVDVYKSIMQYEQNAERYKKDHATKLCRDLLRIISSGTPKEFHFFLSAIVEITGNLEVFQELIRLCAIDSSLSKEQRYFAYCQLLFYKFTHPEVNCKAVVDLLDELYGTIYDAYFNEIKGLYKKIPKEERNEEFVIVMTSQVLSMEHGPTKTLLDRCYIMAERLHKKIYIINTADTLPDDSPILWYNAHKGNYDAALNEKEYLTYKNFEFPFLQCPDGAPDVSVIREILQIVAEEKPWCIVSIGGENITADLCSQIVPVLSVTLGPSERTQCRTTFQMTGHRMDEDDIQWIQRNHLPKDHLIEGLFTSAFKEQKHVYDRKQLGLPEGKTMCLVVGGRLDQEVSDEFISLLDRLAKDDIYTVFMGRLNDFDKICLENSEEFRKHMINLGFQEDALAIYECCDIYLNPKRLGGGTSGAEALYKGLPVLTHNYGDVAIGVGEEFWVRDYEEMYAETIKLAQDQEYYKNKSEKAKKRAAALMDSETEFVRIIREMESRESFF